VTASGTGPFTYQWSKDNNALSGQTASSLTLNNVGQADVATYSVTVTGACGSPASSSATLSLYASVSADPLVSQTNCPGSTLSFSTAAHGTGPYSFQWVKDGTALSGQTGSSLTLSSINANSAGVYAVQVTGLCGSLTNAATLTVNTNTTADPLASQTNCPGASLTLSTTAHGTGPFTYKWIKDGKALPGGTGSSWHINSATVLDAGIYNVIVTGTCNAFTNTATVVIHAPTTATALINQTNCFGRTTTFSTTPSGSGPFSYVWRKDGSLLSGQTSSSLTAANLKAVDAGLYTVEVSGLCNSVTNSAWLAVTSDGLVSPATFANPAPITINDFSPATPYPSTLEVSCVPSPLTQLSVTVSNLSHTYSSDVDLLLVGPTGQAIMLMSDAGGANPISQAVLGFSDGAAAGLSDTAPITSGVYRPTSYPMPHTMPVPAPPGPYASALSAFNGTDANGTWSLYVVDDALLDTGEIAGGWSLTLAWGPASHSLVSQLTGPTLMSDGCSQMTLLGEGGQTYVIEASGDLVNWSPILTNTLNGSSWDFVDTDSTNYTQRFYRAVVRP